MNNRGIMFTEQFDDSTTLDPFEENIFLASQVKNHGSLN